MAIGSAPEIGTTFTTWGEMNVFARRDWFDHIRLNWGPDLVNGYGTLVQIERGKMKGILITEKNRGTLASRFVVEAFDQDEVLPLGYIMVTEFGNDETFSVLTTVNFNAEFEKTGVDLKDGWFEVRRLD